LKSIEEQEEVFQLACELLCSLLHNELCGHASFVSDLQSLVREYSKNFLFVARHAWFEFDLKWFGLAIVFGWLLLVLLSE